jgi:hypothetical protein
MSFINWMTVGITSIILIITIVAKIYYEKKLSDLDGYIAIISSENEDE